jgi:putative sugar O-methyltransferase
VYRMGVSHNLRILLDRIRNRRKLWDLDIPNSLASKNPKSLSELDDYLTLCALAATNIDYFNKFRSCKSYRAILENVDGLAGENLLSVIESYGKSGAEFRHLWHSEIGKPYTYQISGLGRISPTELRYSKIVCELEILFGSLDGFKITEIGVGFGGQGGQILRAFAVAEYEFVDLSEPLQLVKRYLSEIKASENVRLTSPDRVLGEKRDLVISNYAFSELTLELQEEYFEKIVSRSEKGFFIYNQITPDEYRTMSAKEFAARIEGAEIFSERPLSHPGNVVVVWGHKNRLLNY